MKILTLIDANALIHRSYHALPPLTARDGRVVQALYGISTVLMRLRAEGALDYAAALFDRPEPTFRKIKYDEYKATRKETAPDLIAQIIEAHELFETFGVHVFEKAGYEADDCVATLAEKYKTQPDVHVSILTGDMDALQLVEDPKVHVRAFGTGITKTTIYDEAAVEEKWGIAPSQVASYKALVGDNSDNIKGVTGIGPKGAMALLKEFGSIDGIYKNIDKITKYKDLLVRYEAQCRLSEDLATAVRDVPLELGDSIESLAVAYDKEKIKAMFEEIGFMKLIDRLEGVLPPAREPKKPKKQKGAAPETPPGTAQSSMF